MEGKLFTALGSENTEGVICSQEDMSYSIDRDQLSIENLMMALEAEVLLNEVNMESDDYMNKWENFCNVTGMEFDPTISKEALVSKKEGTTSLVTRLVEGFKDGFSDLNTVAHTFAGFKVEKIEALIKDIESGVLVPRKELQRVTKERIQDKWSPFFLFGGSLSKSSDIIDYLKEPVDNLTSGNYESFFSKHWKIMWSADADKAKPYKFIQLPLKNIKMQLKISEKQKEDVLISFLIKRFGPKLNMYSLFHSNDKSYEGMSGWDPQHPFANNIDILPIPGKYVEDVKPMKKEEMLKVLNWLVDNNRDIKKAITEAKILFHKYNAKAAVVGIIASSPYTIVAHQLLAGRAIKSLITHIGNVSKDMIYYDNLAIDLVNAMFERK